MRVTPIDKVDGTMMFIVESASLSGESYDVFIGKSCVWCGCKHFLIRLLKTQPDLFTSCKHIKRVVAWAEEELTK